MADDRGSDSPRVVASMSNIHGQVIWAKVRNPISGKETRLEIDDPQLDATDGAHAAWWRGHDHTMKVITEQLQDAMGIPRDPRMSWSELHKLILAARGDQVRFHKLNP